MQNEAKLLSLLKLDNSKELAFKTLVKRYKEKLYWHIRNMVDSHDDTDDILQNVFIKTWKGLQKFRGESGLYTWMYRIATNESLTFIAKKKHNIDITQPGLIEFLPTALQDEAYQSGDDIHRKLDHAISTLPDKQKAVFNLRYFEEMKYDDIAEIMGTSVGAQKASYHHALKKIESFLKDD